MTNILKYSKPKIFADDTNFIFSMKYIDNLPTNIQYNLFSVTHWLFSSTLTLNIKKNKVMLYNIRNSKSKKKLLYMLLFFKYLDYFNNIKSFTTIYV